jgi:uncharacterized protein (DUF983 family)
MGTVDDLPFDTTCPECGHQIHKTIAWLKTKPNCPGCGVRFDLDERSVQEANQAIADFERKIDDQVRRALE